MVLVLSSWFLECPEVKKRRTAHGALARKTAHVQAGHKRLHTPTDACLHSMASSERVHTEAQQAERVRHARLWSADRGSRSIESVFCKGCVVADSLCLLRLGVDSVSVQGFRLRVQRSVVASGVVSHEVCGVNC